MNWMAGLGNNHTLLAHLPLAAVLMLPIPILAALRGGRGIRPWWITCHYLAWAGVLTSLAAVLSGFLRGWSHGPAFLGALWGSGDQARNDLLRLHLADGVASLLLGLVCLQSLYRHRLEHQGIGLKPLLLGLLWCAGVLTTFYTGTLLGVPGPRLIAPAVAPRPAAPAAPAAQASSHLAAQDPEASAPLRALDFASLTGLHAEPVKSAAHGNRWIRVWITPAAAQLYQAGQPLPPGTLAVMTTVEDRWGRPGYDLGPLYALEIKADGKPSFTFYWPQVPAARQGATQGAQRAYWRGDDPGLNGCRACHAQGAAAAKDRSRCGPPRKPKTGSVPPVSS